MAKKKLSTEQKKCICEALAFCYIDWREPHNYTLTTPSAKQIAIDGATVLSQITPLPASSYATFLNVIKDNGRTDNGKYLAIFLAKKMPKEFVVHHIEKILDILEKPPGDNPFGNEFTQEECLRIPEIFMPQQTLTHFELKSHDKSFSEPEREMFVDWCNEACDPAWLENIPEAMRMLVVRSGKIGLDAVCRRLENSSKSHYAKLQLLMCIAEIDPESPLVVHLLLEILDEEKAPDWMLASKVMRNIEVSEGDTSQLQAVWKNKYNKVKQHDHWLEDDYRFLFAIGATNEGISLLEKDLPVICKVDASPPFHMFFFEDIPYYPNKYKKILEKLLNVDAWRQRCVAAIMLHKYTDYPKANPNVLNRMAESDPHPFVREICQQFKADRKKKRGAVSGGIKGVRYL